MPSYTIEGDLFAAGADAIVNPVNVREAVMGAGLAKEVARRWPGVLAPYRAACRSGELCIGTVLVTPVDGPAPLRAVIHFPTKDSWKAPSTMAMLEAGLPALSAAIREHGFTRVAVPALGCGLGGLSWPAVRDRLQEWAADLDEVDLTIFSPAAPVRRHGRR